MPRLKIMKNSENENKLLNKKSNKKSEKSKAPKKKKTTYYAEDGIFYCSRKNVVATNNKELGNELYKELNSKLNEKTVEEKIKDKVVEEISDEDTEKTSKEISDEANEISNDKIIQGTKLKKLKKNTSLYELLVRPSGATMEELEKELGWKKASIRGTISNLQKEQQFCLMTVNITKPNLDSNNKSFYKEIRYFIKSTNLQ